MKDSKKKSKRVTLSTVLNEFAALKDQIDELRLAVKTLDHDLQATKRANKLE